MEGTVTRLIAFFAVATLVGGCGATSSTAWEDSDGGPVQRGTERSVETHAEAASVSGFCDKYEVVLPVRRRAGDIGACYEERLKDHPRLSGRVEATWTLGKDGRVSSVATTGPEQLGACVATVIKSIRFRPPGIGCEVISRYPFVFHRE